MQGIYQVRNRVNGKRYIGSSNNVTRRLKEHRSALERSKHGNSHLQYAWNKYGEENFAFESVEEVSGGQKARLDHEQIYLDEGFRLSILYNMVEKADCPPSAKGLKRSCETKAKISRAKKGQVPWTKGRSRSEECKRKLSEALTGRTPTKEHRVNLSKALMGNTPWNKGVPRSEECRRKISKTSARPYPAFFNEKTEEFIPAGRNLRVVCEERSLSYYNMWNVKTILNRVTMTGWRRATSKEIEEYGIS